MWACCSCGDDKLPAEGLEIVIDAPTRLTLEGASPEGEPEELSTNVAEKQLPEEEQSSAEPKGVEQETAGDKIQEEATKKSVKAPGNRSVSFSADPQEVLPLGSVVSQVSSRSFNSKKDMCVQLTTISAKGVSVLAQRVLRQSTSLPPEIMEMISFGDTDLLRGTKLSEVMRRPSVFKCSTGSAKTYQLSKRVDGIDVFISHNWSVPRYVKFCCLALHFNFSCAVVLTFCILMGVMVFNAFELLPLVHSDPLTKRGIMGRIVGTPIFLVLLFFAGHLGTCGRRRTPVVFLDKTCIHQVDTDLQRQGIKRLGAFICCSSEMLVCYTDLYLQKLWTVYEVASFLSLHPVSSIKVIPTQVPLFIITGLCGVYVMFFLTLITPRGSWVPMVGFTVLGFGWMAMCRSLARTRAGIQTRLANFRIEDTHCACEDDRPLVYNNIAALMRAIELVPTDSSNDEALAAFSRFVREVLPSAMLASLPSLGIKYSYALCVVFFGGIGAWNAIDDGWVYMSFTVYPRHFILKMASDVATLLGIWPLLCALSAQWAGRRMHLRSWAEKLYLFIGVILIVYACLFLVATMERLRVGGKESDKMLLLHGLFCLALLLTTYIVYSGKCWPFRKA